MGDKFVLAGVLVDEQLGLVVNNFRAKLIQLEELDQWPRVASVFPIHKLTQIRV